MPTGVYKHKRRMEHVKITCVICSFVFEVSPGHSDRKYCSVMCYRKSQFGKKNALGPHKKYGSRPERNRLQSLRFSGAGHPQWNPDRKAQEEKIKVAQLHRNLLNRLVSCFGTKKIGHTSEQLGYTAEQLKNHLESLFEHEMNWKNHGKGMGKWNIDHIRPVYSFPLNSLPREVNALKNLRPLWETENLSRPKKGWTEENQI
jgi:hypothetical protein